MMGLLFPDITSLNILLHLKDLSGHFIPLLLQIVQLGLGLLTSLKNLLPLLSEELQLEVVRVSLLVVY